MDVESLSVKELRAELEARGLSIDAVEKSDLARRLHLALESQSLAPDPTPHAAATPVPTAPEDEEVSRVLACPATNFYQILGVSSSASAADLKLAYRRLVGCDITFTHTRTPACV